MVNKEGGNQVIGLNYVANAKPDGQTIGYTNIPSIFGRYLDPSKKAAFDRESFTPDRFVRLQRRGDRREQDSPYGSIKELFDAVKAEPGKITVGTDSRAGDDHVNLRVLEKELGLDFNIVHYNSGADKIAAIDLRRGGLRPRRHLQLLRPVQVRRDQDLDRHQGAAEPVHPGRAHAGERRLQGRPDDEQLRRLRPGQDAASTLWPSWKPH